MAIIDFETASQIATCELRGPFADFANGTSIGRIPSNQGVAWGIYLLIRGGLCVFHRGV